MKNSNYLHNIKSFFIIIATVMIIACNADTKSVEKLAKEAISTEDTTLKWIDFGRIANPK
jgi:hypothetical protein